MSSKYKVWSKPPKVYRTLKEASSAASAYEKRTGHVVAITAVGGNTKRDPSDWKRRAASHVYASPEVKRTASYKRAEGLEKRLAPDLWMTKGLTLIDLERVADAWDRAGFFGWADNYRAHARQGRVLATPKRKIGRPARDPKMSFADYSAYVRALLEKHYPGLVRSEGWTSLRVDARRHFDRGHSPVKAVTAIATSYRAKRATS